MVLSKKVKNRLLIINRLAKIRQNVSSSKMRKIAKNEKTDFFDVFEETVRGWSFFQVFSDRFKVFVRHFQ